MSAYFIRLNGKDCPLLLSIIISNTVNYLSEIAFCSKNDKIVTEISLKSLRTKKDKKITLAV